MLKLFINLQILADRLRTRQEGQTMAEYGVVLGVITVLCIVAFTTLSTEIKSALKAVSDILPG